jgi:hypothetical protein
MASISLISSIAKNNGGWRENESINRRNGEKLKMSSAANEQ